MSQSSSGKFTGRHAFTVLFAFFAVVIAVNVLMARFAIGTFGGVVVENSYVASQDFNGWLAKARASAALGWHGTVTREPDGRVALRLDGAPAGVKVIGEAWHPLGSLPDRKLAFAPSGPGYYVSDIALPAGRWTLRLEARAGSSEWREELELK